MDVTMYELMSLQHYYFYGNIQSTTWDIIL